MASTNSTKKSKGGLLAGIILIIIGSIVLIGNEKNTVKNIKTVDELRKKVVDVKDAKILNENDGKLVAVSGKIDYLDATLSDPIFNVSIKSPKLVRTVEMYQYVEEKENNGDTDKYVYKTKWSSDLIDSDEFNDTSYSNPKTMDYESETYVAPTIKLGEYNLSDSQKKLISSNKVLSISNMEGIYLKSDYNIINNYITNSKDYNNPKIGEIRIKYTYSDTSSISVLAMQDGDSFTSFTSKVGKTINKVYSGKLTSTQMIDKIAHSNNTKKWLFRGLGVFIVIIGYISLFNFITNLLEYIPILGNIASGLIKLVAGLIGFIHALIIIIVAWFRYRPVLSLVLIAITVAIVLFIKFKTNKSKIVEEKVDNN